MHGGMPLGRSENPELQQLLSQYDGPAYIRRARRVQDAFDQLFARCRAQREEWLEMVRIRLGTLFALAGDWTLVGSLLEDASQLDALRQWHAEMRPELRAPIKPTLSSRRLRQALDELAESVERFNQRWQQFLEVVDLSPVNQARDAYNRYYLLEKECALHNARLARQGFIRLEPLTHGDLAALLPPLPTPHPFRCT
ncbi:MAG TPA: hypothetical protein VGG61_05465 [Gemmataceae bacterium]|jgi:hypothetical protein